MSVLKTQLTARDVTMAVLTIALPPMSTLNTLVDDLGAEAGASRC